MSFYVDARLTCRPVESAPLNEYSPLCSSCAVRSLLCIPRHLSFSIYAGVDQLDADDDDSDLDDEEDEEDDDEEVDLGDSETDMPKKKKQKSS